MFHLFVCSTPDGDLADYLMRKNFAAKNDCRACYHSLIYIFRLENIVIGIIPYVVGAPYAMLVAEELFVSGCQLLITLTSAGIIKKPDNIKRFALITSSIRDEGTSYHYLPPEKLSLLNQNLFRSLHSFEKNYDSPYFGGSSWTTDAPFRATPTAIERMRQQNVTCVEMEAAALYALSEVKKYNIICFAHLTNSMAQTEGDFEKKCEVR
jgi:uridine phosphorylase